MPIDQTQCLIDTQDGVINRRQALAAGLTDPDIRRRLRRREWARVHPGVYVDHTGPLSWRQRAWAAVLYAEPAALWGESALRGADGPGRRTHDDTAPVHVVIDRDRHCRAVAGIVVHRSTGLATRVQWNLGPPRMRVEDAVLDVAAGAVGDFAAVAVIADAVSSRRTTAARVMGALAGRARIARRAFLEAVLEDVRVGACSALEQSFLRRVEHAHGLPAGSRQVHASSRGPVYRDVLYESFGVVVELDGRLDHSAALDRDRDLDRDLDAAEVGLTTVRLGWGQAVGRPCRTARVLGELLNRRGWIGRIRTCRRCRRGDPQPPGDEESPQSA